MLEKRKILDQIEIKNNGIIFIKELNQIVEDGIVISSIPHRTSFNPLDDISSCPYQMVISTANILWTQEVKDAYAAQLTSQNKPLGL